MPSGTELWTPHGSSVSVGPSFASILVIKSCRNGKVKVFNRLVQSHLAPRVASQLRRRNKRPHRAINLERLKELTPLVPVDISDDVADAQQGRDGWLVPPIPTHQLAFTHFALVTSPIPGFTVNDRRLAPSEKRKGCERLQDVLSVIDVAVAAVGSTVRCHATKGVTAPKFVHEILHGYDGDVEALAIKVKEFSSNRRCDYILHRGDQSDAQLSYMGRALPLPTKESMDAALVAHAEALGTRFDTDPKILADATRFARTFAMKNIRGKELEMLSVPSASACSESTVRKGGLRGWVARALHGTPLQGSLSSGFFTNVAETVIFDRLAKLVGQDVIDGFPPTSQAIVLGERGLKTRVITKSPALLHLVGHLARRKLLAGLKRLPAVRSVLSGAPDEEILSRYTGARGQICVSTDLSKASDMLPLDLMSALLDGLEQSGRFTPLEIMTLFRATAQQTIAYPKHLHDKIAHLPGVTEGRLLTQRGILMGLPSTWTFLSLTHLFWWDRAKRLAFSNIPQRGRVNRSAFMAENVFDICGDDCLFVGHTRVSDMFKEVVASCGGAVSQGKHFEHHVDASGRLRGTFLERIYNFKVYNRKVTSSSRLQVVPLKGFLGRPSLDIGRRTAGSAVSIPLQVSVMANTNNLWSQLPGATNVLSRVAEYVCPDIHEYASSKLGLTPGLPTSLFGNGVPTREPVNIVEGFSEVVTVLRAAGVISAPSLADGVVDPLWRLATRRVEERLKADPTSDNAIVLLRRPELLLYKQPVTDTSIPNWHSVIGNEASYTEMYDARSPGSVCFQAIQEVTESFPLGKDLSLKDSFVSRNKLSITSTRVGLNELKLSLILDEYRPLAFTRRGRSSAAPYNEEAVRRKVAKSLRKVRSILNGTTQLSEDVVSLSTASFYVLQDIRLQKSPFGRALTRVAVPSRFSSEGAKRHTTALTSKHGKSVVINRHPYGPLMATTPRDRPFQPVAPSMCAPPPNRLVARSESMRFRALLVTMLQKKGMWEGSKWWIPTRASLTRFFGW